MVLKNLNDEYAIKKCIYLNPILNYKEKDSKNTYTLLNTNLIGIYLEDTNKPEWEQKIIFCYKNYAGTDVKKFFENSIYSYQNYTEKLENEIYDIFSFTIPFQFKNDVQKIIQCEFNNLSINYEYLAEEYYKKQVIYSVISSMMFKDKLGLNDRKLSQNYYALDLNKVLKKAA